MRSFIKSHRRTNSDETAIEGGDALRLVGDLSLRSRLKNPITFIKQRRRASCEDAEHIPSAADYKEAGSIFGTRTHDWGSLRSDHEQQPEPTPDVLIPAAQKATTEPVVETKLESEIQNPTVQIEQTHEKNHISNTADEGIQELENAIDDLIYETLNASAPEVLPPQSSGDDEIAANGKKVINSSSSSRSRSSSDSGHSEFSFEEDERIGRNTSVSFHTTPDDVSSTPATAATSSASGSTDAAFEMPASQFQDEYYDDFDEIYQRNNGHLLGLTQYKLADGSGLPQFYPSFNTVNTHDGYNDGHSGSYNNNSFKEDDDDDDLYDSLLDEVNAVPDEDVDDVPPPLQRNNSRSSYTSPHTTPASYYRSASRQQMLRKAKSYSFEGSRTQLAASSLTMRRRQTSVIKSDTTTTTLFGKLAQETAPLPMYLNTQSSASFLSKKLSNASSLSNLTTLSTSNMSLKDGLDYYYDEDEVDDDIENLELCYPSKASTALTPISERSYDSDYSRSPI